MVTIHSYSYILLSLRMCALTLALVPTLPVTITYGDDDLFFSASKPIIALRGGWVLLCSRHPRYQSNSLTRCIDGHSVSPIYFPLGRGADLCDDSPKAENVQCTLRTDLFDIKSLMDLWEAI